MYVKTCVCVTDQTLYPVPWSPSLQTPARRSAGSRCPKRDSPAHTPLPHPQSPLSANRHTNISHNFLYKHTWPNEDKRQAHPETQSQLLPEGVKKSGFHSKVSLCDTSCKTVNIWHKHQHLFSLCNKFSFPLKNKQTNNTPPPPKKNNNPDTFIDCRVVGCFFNSDKKEDV